VTGAGLNALMTRTYAMLEEARRREPLRVSGEIG
jgi:hypothetical protein